MISFRGAVLAVQAFGMIWVCEYAQSAGMFELSFG